MTSKDVVTGAFSYTGRHVAQLLLAKGRSVGTLTDHPGRQHRLASAIDVHPLRFEDPDSLTRALEGADTLYNTYWVRFVRGDATFERAVENTEVLVKAAVHAGVRRIVHVSIASVEDGRGLPYFDGKAACEQIVKASGCTYAIVRPTVLFGGTDVFISNLAWLLRRFPIFAVAGDGRYGIQPVHVEDHARLMVEAGSRSGSEIFDSAGPETFAFEDFVRSIASAIDRSARLVHVHPTALTAMGRMIGILVRDVVLNREELDGLMRDLMRSKEIARGTIRFSDWLTSAAGELGRNYANEISRHYTGATRSATSRAERSLRS
jgi:NADH dehydrogenase